MAQVLTSTSTPSVSFTKSDLDNLANSFDQGDIATATVYNTLVGYMNELAAHKHTVTDKTYEATGNTNAYPTGSINNTTGVPSTSSTVATVIGPPTPPAVTPVASTIDDYNIDQFVTAINHLSSHYHSINDTIY